MKPKAPADHKIKLLLVKQVMLLSLFVFCFLLPAFSQDMSDLINKVKARLDAVSDYTAEGVMKTNVAFIKAPISKVKVFYKKPDRFKVKRDGGISVLPKGGVSFNLNSVLSMTNFAAIAAGDITINGTPVKIVKLIPLTENQDIILTTLYIDDKNLLIRKASTTTRENGTYEMEMSYGKYSNYGLPDKVIFSFNTKDYKLPKGLTLEFEDSDAAKKMNKLKNKKGTVEIHYKNYQVNKGVDDAVFKG
ncbi:MAG: hypothetical protein JWN76_2284 [Chitinophagaceae bacterium]|nr:hypothetical protein [Chitinophagaceae bacterium]